MSEQTGMVAPAVRAEARLVGQEMAESYRSSVRRYRQDGRLSTEEAIARVDKPASKGTIDRLLSESPEHLSWDELRVLGEHDPALAWNRWESIRQEASEQLRSGARAARVIGVDKKPMEMAQFLAIREELAAEWEPRNGVERTLIEQMAIAHAQFLIWTRTLTNWMGRLPEDQPVDDSYLRPPRVDYDAAIERAAGMVDRFNKLFLRCLRNLRDLRRYAPAIIVQNAGQVNVGQQQVNVSRQGVAATDMADAAHLPECNTTGEA